ncbi:hypothetical protein H072_1672 [Dactylellina haptotyla CBS 200.50]|uniref:Rhodopsin domain-containing protein n=1 Tax=Dactylellina haptotyla (strain CBS 200.50) TaxID=1284197 RepID=S8AN50_DACHA|nr:hypothetical protein H072_1672 [Dactylellina haptotyla CBS 200.50]
MWAPPNRQTDADREYLRNLFPLFKNLPNEENFQFPLAVDPDYVPPINTFYCFMSGAVLISLATGTVSLRLWVRSRGVFGTDDWVMLAAFLFYCALNVVNVTAVFGSGLGYHLYDNSMKDIYAFLVLEFLHVIFLFCTLHLCRCSIIHLFLRLAHLQSPTQQRYLYFVNTLSYLFMIGCVLFEVFDCGVPVAHNSFRLQSQFDGTCVGARSMLAYGLLIAGHIILDALTIFPPLVVLVRLPLAPGKKFNLIFLLILGVFTMVSSAIRLYVFYRIMLESFDLTWHATGVAFWGILESSLAAIIVSLPALNQVMIKFFKGVRERTTGGPNSTITGRGMSIFERHQFFRGAGKFLSFSAGGSAKLTVSGGGTIAPPDNTYVELGDFKSERQTKTASTVVEQSQPSPLSPPDIMQRTANDLEPDITRTFFLTDDLEQQREDGDSAGSMRNVQRPERTYTRRPSSPTISRS